MDERFRRFRYLMQQIEAVARERLQNCKFAEHAGVTFTPETADNITRVELIIDALERRNQQIDDLLGSGEPSQSAAVDQFVKSELRLSVDALSDLIGTERSSVPAQRWQEELEELLEKIESEVGLTFEKKQYAGSPKTAPDPV